MLYTFRRIRNFDRIRVVGGTLDTLVPYIPFQDVQQWRTIEKLYSQRLYRFPAYNLAILVISYFYFSLFSLYFQYF